VEQDLKVRRGRAGLTRHLCDSERRPQAGEVAVASPVVAAAEAKVEGSDNFMSTEVPLSLGALDHSLGKMLEEDLEVILPGW
jgi:hypothetical protein